MSLILKLLTIDSEIIVKNETAKWPLGLQSYHIVPIMSSPLQQCDSMIEKLINMRKYDRKSLSCYLLKNHAQNKSHNLMSNLENS